MLKATDTFKCSSELIAKIRRKSANAELLKLPVIQKSVLRTMS